MTYAAWYYDLFDANAFWIKSLPISFLNLDQTGCSLVTQAWRCSGVNVRTTPPAAIMLFLFSLLIRADSA